MQAVQPKSAFRVRTCADRFPAGLLNDDCLTGQRLPGGIDDLPGALSVYVDQVVDSGSGWQSAFRIEHAGRLLAAGRCAVIKFQA